MDPPTVTPRIIYQTWKDQNIPKKFARNQKRWLDFCRGPSPRPWRRPSSDRSIHQGTGIPDPDRPGDFVPPGWPSRGAGWKYVFLDDQGLRRMVEENFPQYLSAYDGFTKPIERVDFARLVMMYLGGVYADMDTYPTQSIDRWVDLNKIVLGREPVEHARELYDNRTVVLCNAFMISPPKRGMWIELMDYIIKNYEPNYKPVYNTGPMAMTIFSEWRPELFTPQAGVVITDPCVFFPMLGTGKYSERCIDRQGQLTTATYVVHEWENTWVVPWYKDPEWLNTRYWFWASLSLLVIIWLRRSGN